MSCVKYIKLTLVSVHLLFSNQEQKTAFPSNQTLLLPTPIYACLQKHYLGILMYYFGWYLAHIQNLCYLGHRGDGTHCKQCGISFHPWCHLCCQLTYSLLSSFQSCWECAPFKWSKWNCKMVSLSSCKSEEHIDIQFIELTINISPRWDMPSIPRRQL